MVLAAAEPLATATLLAVFGALLVASVVFARAAERVGVPIVLLFLLLGMLGGSEGIGGIAFDDYGFAFRIGTAALVLILFDGGLATSYASVRRSIGPAGALATLGVIVTAAITALLARLLGLSWPEAALIGAVVSSTDAAAVFAVLRGGNLRLKDRVRSVLEVESCANDPMAVVLTVAVIEAIRTGGGLGWRLALEIPLQLAIGFIVGAIIGIGASRLLARIRVPSVGLYPVLTLAAAFVSFGLATLLWGSGFLSVFVTGVVLGNRDLPYRAGLTRVHDAIAWLCQTSMFLMLGLLVFPSRLLPVAWTGLALGLGLAFIARPVAVALCLVPFRLPWKELLFVAWVGLRGAVPIVLATFPEMYGIPGGDRIFHIVFFIVVVSALAPGASIVPLTRRLGLDEPARPTPSAALEIHSLRPLGESIRPFHIDRSLAVCGASLSQIRFPPAASAILVVRGDQLIAARGDTVLREGDHIHVFFRPEDRPYIELLFGRPQDESPARG